jgi:hypothetical protein
MRSAHSRPVTVGLATGLFVLASGVTGTAMAATTPSPTATKATSTPSASASSSPSAAVSKASASPSSKASASPSASASSTPSTIKATTSATPTPSASATGTSSATPTPTPSTSATPKPVADIAVTSSATSVEPGATILFRISAYTNLKASATGKITSTLTPSKTTPAFAAPVFTVDTCSSTSGTTCNLSVPIAKPAQPQVETQLTVPKTATGGETVKYSATVTVADGSTTLTATATAPTITVKAASSASASPSKKTTSAAAGSGSPSTPTSAGATVDLPGLSGTTENVGAAIPLGALPAVAGVAGVSTTIPAGNASNLFPQISPSSTPSPSPGTAVADPAPAKPVADSSRIPLSLGSSEFGAQIIGLIVLLLGVAIAVTRLSLRKSRPNK